MDDAEGSAAEADVIYTWGRGEHGVLGQAELADCPEPREVAALRAEFVRAVGAGGAFTACATGASDVLIFGTFDERAGVCGMPTPVRTLPFVGESIASVSCGRWHVCCVSDEGSAFSWGRGGSGQLGHGSTVATDAPRRIDALAGRAVVRVACGAEHCVAVLDGGLAASWGRNDSGQLGLGEGALCAAQPTPLSLRLADADGRPAFVADVACGAEHTLLLTTDARVLSCGSRAHGQLGSRAAAAREPAPAPVDAPVSHARCAGVACGRQHSLVLCASGELYVFGRNDMRQLGFADTRPRSSPALLPPAQLLRAARPRAAAPAGAAGALSALSVASVHSCHGHTSLALTDGGVPLVWGRTLASTAPPAPNGASLRGAPDADSSSDSGEGAGDDAAGGGADGADGGGGGGGGGDAAGGGAGGGGVSGCVAERRGGRASAGAKPARALRELCGGLEHAVGLTELGGVATWGGGMAGALGHPSLADAAEPARVRCSALPGTLGARQAVQLCCGGGPHALLLTDDARVWAWGRGARGELGLGARVQRAHAPMPLTLLAAAAARGVGAGGGADGAAACAAGPRTGDGERAADGADAQPPDRARVEWEPAACVPLRARSIGAGAAHSLAVSEAGALLGWGSNARAQLGRRAPDEAWAAVPVEGEACAAGLAFLAVDAGARHSGAIDDTGAVWAWGLDDERQASAVAAAREAGVGGAAAAGAGPGRGAAAPALVRTPQRVPLRAGARAVQLAMGHAHSAALDADGTVHIWGHIGGCRLRAPRSLGPECFGGARVAQLSAGGRGMLALTRAPDAGVYEWRTPDAPARRGPRPPADAPSSAEDAPPPPPSRVPELDGCRVRAVACGPAHALAATEGGAVHAWGSNALALGLGSAGAGAGPTSRVPPQPVRSFGGVLPCAHLLACGAGVSMAVARLRAPDDNYRPSTSAGAPVAPGAGKGAAEPPRRSSCTR